MPKTYNNDYKMLKQQQGVTMIEAMISIMLFAVGALGLVAMQYSSVVGTGDNQQRTAAIWKVQELANRIKSNPGQIGAYINQVNNGALATIGVDSAANVITCGAGNYAAPARRCADYIPAGGGGITNGATCTDVEKVSFDVWDVFCEPNTGAAVTATANGDAADGSSGLTDVELVLRQNTVAADGNNDFAIYMAWLSREGEKAAGEAAAVTNISTNLCGRATLGGAAPVPIMTDIDARLDVYCLRFRP